MKLESNRVIQAKPDTVWEHLVSVDVLKQCIPGCRSMEQTGENEYALTMKTKVGPVSATFKGELSLRDVVPGESYTLHFEGKGGAAGFANGSAAVRLEPVDEGTSLVYAVDARVGGKIAQVGQRLVDGTARKMADDFFSQLEQVVAPLESGDARAEEPRPQATSATGARNGSAAENRSWMWIGGGVILLLIIVLLWAGT